MYSICLLFLHILLHFLAKQIFANGHIDNMFVFFIIFLNFWSFWSCSHTSHYRFLFYTHVYSFAGGCSIIFLIYLSYDFLFYLCCFCVHCCFFYNSNWFQEVFYHCLSLKKTVKTRTHKKGLYSWFIFMMNLHNGDTDKWSK